MRSPGFYAALANSMVVGEANADAIAGRLAHTLGRNWRWIRPLVQRYVARFGATPRPRRKTVEQFLKRDEGLARALNLYRDQVRIAAWIPPTSTMEPASAARDWGVPAIGSVAR